MTQKQGSVFAGIALVLAGCQSLVSGEDIAARITNPTDHSRAALRNTINEVLNTHVALADDALTDSSVLIIEQHPPRSMQNLPAQGRNMGTPLQFALVLNGSDCILIDQRDNSRHRLEKTTCTAE